MQRFCHSRKKTEVGAIKTMWHMVTKAHRGRGMVVEDRGDGGEVAERGSDGGTWR